MAFFFKNLSSRFTLAGSCRTLWITQDGYYSLPSILPSIYSHISLITPSGTIHFHLPQLTSPFSAPAHIFKSVLSSPTALPQYVLQSSTEKIFGFSRVHLVHPCFHDLGLFSSTKGKRIELYQSHLVNSHPQVLTPLIPP